MSRISLVGILGSAGSWPLERTSTWSLSAASILHPIQRMESSLSKLRQRVHEIVSANLSAELYPLKECTRRLFPMLVKSLRDP